MNYENFVEEVMGGYEKVGKFLEVADGMEFEMFCVAWATVFHTVCEAAGRDPKAMAHVMCADIESVVDAGF